MLGRPVQEELHEFAQRLYRTFATMAPSGAVARVAMLLQERYPETKAEPLPRETVLMLEALSRLLKATTFSPSIQTEIDSFLKEPIPSPRGIDVRRDGSLTADPGRPMYREFGEEVNGPK